VRVLCAQCLWLLALDALADREIDRDRDTATGDDHAIDDSRGGDRGGAGDVGQYLRDHIGQHANAANGERGNASSSRERGRERKGSDMCLPLALHPYRDAALRDVDSAHDEEDEGREWTAPLAPTRCVRGKPAPSHCLSCATLNCTVVYTLHYTAHRCLTS
jgi:hypothetical protein